MASGARWWARARVRVGLVVVLLGMVLPAVGVAFAAHLSYEAIRRRAEAGQASTAASVRDQLRIAVDDRIRLAVAASENEHVLAALTGADASAAMGRFGDRTAAQVACAWVVRDVAGAVVATVAVPDPVLAPLCPPAAPAAVAMPPALPEQRPAVARTGLVVLPFWSPVVVDGRTIGSVEADLPAQALLLSNTFGDTGTASVVEQDGLILSSATAASRGQKLASPLGVAFARAGRPAVGMTYAPRIERHVLVAYQPLEGTTLGVFASVQTHEAFADYRDLRAKLAAGWVVLALLSLIAGGCIAEVVESRDRRLRAQQGSMQRAHARFAALVEHGRDVITIADAHGRLTFASPAYRVLLGYDPDDDLGSTMAERIVPEDLQIAAACAEEAMRETGGVATCELRLLRSDGEVRHVEATMANRLHDPAVEGIVTNTRDVTERVEASRILAHQARHDSLTGLPNRTLLLDRLSAALDGSALRGRTAVLFLDLDRFKSVNDGLGHSAGDDLLVAIAARLRAAVRPGDTVARIGGDEFVVIAEGVQSTEEAVAVAAALRDAVAAPIQAGGQEVTVGCSIGISFSADHQQPEAVLQEADTALYRAKDRGRNRWELYDQAMRTRARVRLDIERRLREALDGSTFRVLYQPIIDLRDGSTTGAEALLRLDDHAGQPLDPAEFISVAEESGLIVPIGLEVLREACRAAATWTGAPGAPAPTVAVNVSARQLGSTGLVDAVRTVLDEAGLAPGQLCLELTETSLIDAGSSMRGSVDDLAALGVLIALDDFGTGWSSLSYLRHFPISTLKIDRTFVAGLGVDGGDTEVVKAVIGLGRALELDVVAEGVETAAQADALAALGCSHAQGFYLGRPAPSAALPFAPTGPSGT